MEVVYYEGTPVFVDLTGKEYDHWRWNLRHHTSKMELDSQSRGGFEMAREMKVGDKLKLVSDRPDHLWIESPVGTVFEVVGDGWAFHPKNRYGKGCHLCVHSGCGFYSYSGLTPCCAYRVIN